MEILLLLILCVICPPLGALIFVLWAISSLYFLFATPAKTSQETLDMYARWDKEHEASRKEREAIQIERDKIDDIDYAYAYHAYFHPSKEQRDQELEHDLRWGADYLRAPLHITDRVWEKVVHDILEEHTIKNRLRYPELFSLNVYLFTDRVNHS